MVTDLLGDHVGRGRSAHGGCFAHSLGGLNTLNCARLLVVELGAEATQQRLSHQPGPPGQGLCNDPLRIGHSRALDDHLDHAREGRRCYRASTVRCPRMFVRCCGNDYSPLPWRDIVSWSRARCRQLTAVKSTSTQPGLLNVAHFGQCLKPVAHAYLSKQSCLIALNRADT
jgi:hypothetical protein